MRRRDKKYKDYNITEQQANGTIKYILSDKFSERDEYILQQAALWTNPDIAEDLVESISKKKSYDTLYKEKYIPISRNDFYGHRKCCIVNFRMLKLLLGDWRE